MNIKTKKRSYKKIVRKAEFQTLNHENKQLAELIGVKNFKKLLNFRKYQTYIVIYEYDPIGFFSINKEYLKKNILKIECFYIFEKYIDGEVISNIIDDIIYCVYTTKIYEFNFIVADLFIEFCIYFIKKGFLFDIVVDKSKTNRSIISMTKRI
ncbi:hypothetical protein [Methanosphaera sp.]|uniref:hypothetical protein n=1 Tax=Methanosphaera sp. TaxID=2666342 RepID=UPI002A840F5A|nr:hypothetical protein [Methanosphaera sp.]